MKRVLSALLAAMFAVASASALACPADTKTKSDQQINKPDKPKT